MRTGYLSPRKHVLKRARERIKSKLAELKEKRKLPRKLPEPALTLDGYLA